MRILERRLKCSSICSRTGIQSCHQQKNHLVSSICRSKQPPRHYKGRESHRWLEVVGLESVEEVVGLEEGGVVGLEEGGVVGVEEEGVEGVEGGGLGGVAEGGNVS
jgi:hypothetical protein